MRWGLAEDSEGRQDFGLVVVAVHHQRDVVQRDFQTIDPGPQHRDEFEQFLAQGGEVPEVLQLPATVAPEAEAQHLG